MLETLSVNRLAGSLGAEITGVDLSTLSGSDVSVIEQLLYEHLVLFFPGQSLNTDQHVAFGGLFGPLDSHPNLANPFNRHPQVFELAASHGGVADEWHSDLSFSANPSVMSILNMIECPAVGGDTLWASTYAAFESLSPPLQALCEGLTALHDATPHGQPEVCAIHPVVRIHPVTKRRSLFVNEHFTRRIVQLSHEESQCLLTYLTQLIASHRFTVRYKWRKGTIAMWDNRCTQHYVLSDFHEQRIINRVTVMGDVPEGSCKPKWEPYVRARNSGATSRYDSQLNNVLNREVITLESNRKDND